MMRSTVRSMIGVCAALATAAAYGAWQRGDLPLSMDAATGLAAAAIELARAAIAAGLSRSPEMVIGLGAALTLPLVAIAASIWRWLQRRKMRRSSATAADDVLTRTGLTTSPIARAWLNVEGEPALAGHEIRGEILRIGRDRDNDLTLADESIESFHAVIRRTSDAEFMIVDVSGSDGLAVNGKRTSHSRLRHGDRIDLGRTGVIFQRALKAPATVQPGTSSRVH